MLLNANACSSDTLLLGCLYYSPTIRMQQTNDTQIHKWIIIEKIQRYIDRIFICDYKMFTFDNYTNNNNYN